MTPLISARRAEEFARVVDGSDADVADRYADLTACVDLLRTQETPAARTEFVADLRTRLMAAADTLLVPSRAPQSRPATVVTLSPGVRRHNRRLAAAAAAFVVIGGTAGVAAAAENSLPGDPLYPIKRGIESAQVSLNSSDAAKGHDLIGQASTRLHEIDSLMNHGESTSRITQTLSSFQRSATNGADLLFLAYQRGGDPSDLAALRSTFEQQTAQLDALAEQAPPTAQPDFAAAKALIADLDQQARVLCGNCGPSDGSSDFVDLSSAPALESLLTAPAAAAAAQDLSDQAQALADKADQVAKGLPQAPVTQAPDASTRNTTPLPGVQVPSLPGQTTALKSTVTNVTGGVEGLLDTVGTSSGGTLSPLTDTVKGTLDQLTGLLLGGQ
ncbi:MAG: hypothetical protein JF565_02020 [Propionibacteriales bacterium]|nr:hypothetical protein [Propionibacteriales bacterium]